MAAGPMSTTPPSTRGFSARAWQAAGGTGLQAVGELGIHKAALVVFARNQQGNAFWEKMGFTLRTDILYRNRALTEMTRIDT